MAAAPGAAAAAGGLNLGPLQNAMNALVAQGDNQAAMAKVLYYAKGVPHCDGTVPSEFRNWLQTIDLLVPQVVGGLIIAVASNTSTGTLHAEV